jgi:lysozyme
LPPVIDLEFTGNCKEKPNVENVQNEIKVFIDRIDSYYGRRSIIYLTDEFIDKYMDNKLLNHPIWIRNIFFHPNTFDSLDWVIWQYKSRGRIDGINGPVDLNLLNGNLNILTSD